MSPQSTVEEQRKAQEQMQDHQANLQQASQMAPSYSDRREYLEAVIDDDLNDGTVSMLMNLTSPDFILSNFDKAEINELKWLREVTLKKVFAAHPSQASVMQGRAREQVYEDGSPVQPLNQKQKTQIKTFVRGAYARLARSKDGFQQEQFGKVISASERRTQDSDEGGLLDF